MHHTMSERIETADMKLFLKHKIKDYDYLTDKYIIQDDRGEAKGSYGIVVKVRCRDSGNLYAIKKVTWTNRINPRRSRHPGQEEEIEERITQFYQMFSEAVVHQRYELNNVSAHLMQHHFHKSWCVLPPAVTADDLIDFVDSDNGLTPELLGKFTGAELYMVFELMDTTMMSIMRKGIPQAASRKQEMMPILSQTNQGLASLHEKGLVHGDIKPDNILLRRDDHNNVKLGDFGLTTDVTSVSVANEMTESRYRYFGFAPEAYLSVKYDIFSYGVVFFAALVFMQTNIIVRRITLKKLRRCTLGGDIAQLRRLLNRHLIDQSKHLIELTIQCLQLDPSDRPNCKIIASVVDNDDKFVSAKNSVELFVAQKFMFRPGFQPEQMIYPSFVRNVLKTYRRIALNQDPEWIKALERFLTMEGDDKVVDVYYDWDVLMKDEFVRFLNEYM